MRCYPVCLVAVLLLRLPAPGAQAQADVAITLPGEVLVVPPVGRYGRTPAPVDAVQARFAAGTWQTPKPGATLMAPDGRQRKWAAVPFKDGHVTHAALKGGYACFVVPAPEERVMLLEASGHLLVLVNGEPRVGDAYQAGYVRIPLLLRKGDNELLFHVARGSLRARLVEAKRPALLHLGDVTVPDLLLGQEIDTRAAVVVLNTTPGTLEGLTLSATAGEGRTVRTPLPPLPPLTVRKVGFPLRGPAPTRPEPVGVELRLEKAEGGARKEIDAAKLPLQVRRPGETHRRTFVSRLDGSVQYFALVPAQEAPDGARTGLVLSLHGAGVEASGQAACYAPKPGLHVVAPTNRRPFGFDWEDWGRLDALEVLDLAGKELDTDPRRTFLTGHSMGGHGTWHLGVTYPDRFAAIGPSAGWISFWSYAGAERVAGPTALLELVQRAANASDTLALARNCAQHGVYVLHGEADDNVPVGQARTMRTALAGFHPDFAYHERRGAGHWWGNACVDWPEMFAFFGRRQVPARAAVRAVEFRTASPGVSGWCHWVGIDAQRKAMLLSKVEMRHDPGQRTFVGTTDNVARLVLDLAHLEGTGPVRVALDGDRLENIPWPRRGDRLWLEHDGKRWHVTEPPAPSRKGMRRYGPFKDVFRNRMLFVYGTRGAAAENAWALAKARYDAEQFWYRGNGSVDVVADTAFDPKQEPDRNVVLYGNADGNAAWEALLGGGPVQVRRGKLKVGAREEAGNDLACLFVRPRPGSDTALVGAVSGTGVAGLRRTDRLPYFVSGVAYPDWVVLDGTSWTRGTEGIRGAGYFGPDWKVESGESAWREQAVGPRAGKGQ
jgi:pimeloyl-ACP methyl ester carboxylesterase